MDVNESVVAAVASLSLKEKEREEEASSPSLSLPQPLQGADDESTLSKNARKKQLKAARYAAEKPLRRQLEKERKKSRKEEARAAGTYVPSQRKRHGVSPVEQKPFDATLVIDLGFDALMTDREIVSMTQQLSLLYSSNRSAERPFASVLFCGQGRWDPHTFLRSQTAQDERPGGVEDDDDDDDKEEVPLFDSRLGRRMEGKMRASWRRWSGVILCNRGGLGTGAASTAIKDTLASNTPYDNRNAASHLPSHDKIVYLTADTDTTLEAIEEGHAYIIGGLVDRNRYRAICAEKARKLGFKTARLPIEADRLRTSNVMTVNHVVQILLTFNETRSWDAAFDKHLPLRKRREHGDDVDGEQQQSTVA